jgi:hypothetical protein
MTQNAWLALAFKVIDVATLVTIAAFVGYYTKIAAWYRNPVGRTIVLKDLALILVLIPSILGIFFHFSRLTSYIAAWVSVVSFALVPVIMVWRIAVWRKIHKADSEYLAHRRQRARMPEG